MRRLYTLLLYLATPLLIIRLYLKSLKNPAYARRIAERFGYFQQASRPIDIWIHAVSLGEVIAATPLVKQLQQRYPKYYFAITTMTPTGSARVQDAFGASVFHVYIPYDQLGAVQRFLKRIQPKLAIMIETELWPNLFYACHQHQIPILIANARLSPRSLKGYQKIKTLIKETLSWVSVVATQADSDAERYCALGLARNKVSTIGNIKFDLTIPENLTARGEALRNLWGRHRPVLVAASTHEGEDEIILQAFKQIKQHIANAVLILVPRHPERFNTAARLAKDTGLHTVLRTNLDHVNPQLGIVVGNTLGEMLLFFAAADAAFVGGSFILQGGHNVLEPAAVGIPVLTGPHVFNFAEINALLHQAEGIITVHNSEELAIKIQALFMNPLLAARYVVNAALVIKHNQGALAKLLDIVERMIRATD